MKAPHVLYGLLALLPFVFFVGGYLVLSFLFQQNTGSCPSFIGQKISEAIKPISAYPLNARIVAEEEHEELPEGTIVQQKPYPGQRIKPYQSIYLKISCVKKALLMPHFDHASVAHVTDKLASHGYRLKQYALPSSLPEDTIISLTPHAGMPISSKDRVAYAYSSAGGTQIRIIPQLKGQTVAAARAALPNQRVQLKVIKSVRTTTMHEEMNKNEQYIVDQKPLAGNIVDISKPLTMYVTVE